MNLAAQSADFPLAPEPFRRGQILADKYRLESVIGRGGMGVVVAARHLKLDQPVAIKFLASEMIGRDDHVSRFMREARASIRVRSEHVVRVMDVDVSPDGTPYMVMELLEGSDLSSVLVQRGPLGIEETVDYLLQTCEALAAAHALGIIHRDLKTANLFLTRGVDGRPCIKVLDFGICKLTKGVSPADLESSAPSLLGSPSYMSPEQLRSPTTVDAGADIWALAVAAFRLLTQQQPFVGKTVYQLYDQILHGTPTALRGLRPEVPPALEAVLMRCLAKERSARFLDVAELATALCPFASIEARRRARRIGQILGEGESQEIITDGSGFEPTAVKRVDSTPSRIRYTRARTLIDEAPTFEDLVPQLNERWERLLVHKRLLSFVAVALFVFGVLSLFGRKVDAPHSKVIQAASAAPDASLAWQPRSRMPGVPEVTAIVRSEPAQARAQVRRADAAQPRGRRALRKAPARASLPPTSKRVPARARANRGGLDLFDEPR